MSRAFICELIMQWQSATAVRRRAASDRISFTAFRRGCQSVLQNYLCSFIKEAVRTRTISQIHVANRPDCSPPFLYASGASIIESASHPRRTAFSPPGEFFSGSVAASTRNPPPKGHYLIFKVGKSGM